MSNPSLLCVPYRFKTSKLYSQIPDSGLGDFVVTRSASNSATRVNASGLIETVLDNVPRLDYPFGGITAGCPALLVEPSAQNICPRSQEFNTGWGAFASATVTPNTAISPDGTQNAETINLAAVSDSRVQQGITLANSTTYTISCFYKNIALTSGQTFRMRFNNALSAPNNFVATATIDLAAGTASYSLTGTATTGFSGTATGRIENYGNGWYRFSMTFTVGTAGGATGVFEMGSASAVRSFYAWGAQVEASSVPTSYIPTAASPVTRGAETISKTGVSSLIGQTEGTIYAELDFSRAVSTIAIILGNGSSENFRIRKNANFSVLVQAVNTSGSANLFTSPAASAGIYKIAFGYKNGDYAMSVNGAAVLTSPNSVNFPVNALDRIFLGDTVGGVPIFNDRIRAVELYDTRLPNTGPLSLQSLTQ